MRKEIFATMFVDGVAPKLCDCRFPKRLLPIRCGCGGRFCNGWVVRGFAFHMFSDSLTDYLHMNRGCVALMYYEILALIDPIPVVDAMAKMSGADIFSVLVREPTEWVDEDIRKWDEGG